MATLCSEIETFKQRKEQCCTGTRSAFRRSGTRSETERNEPEFVPDFARNGTENPEFVPNFMERNGTRSEKIGTEYNTAYSINLLTIGAPFEI